MVEVAIVGIISKFGYLVIIIFGGGQTSPPVGSTDCWFPIHNVNYTVFSFTATAC